MNALDNTTGILGRHDWAAMYTLYMKYAGSLAEAARNDDENNDTAIAIFREAGIELNAMAEKGDALQEAALCVLGLLDTAWRKEREKNRDC